MASDNKTQDTGLTEDQLALCRAIFNGSLVMNQIFVRQIPKQRFGKTAIRLSYVDIIVIAVITAAVAFAFFMIAYFVTLIPGIGYSKKIGFRVVFALIGVVLGLFAGLAASRFSPYRKTSGEGLGQWLSVQMDKRRYFVDRLIGRKWEMTRQVTWVDGEPIEVDCITYLGSARMPKTNKPRVYHLDEAPDRYKVILAPRTRPTRWIDQVRNKRNAVLSMGNRDYKRRGQ